ncbi:MAG: hypothetical protein NT153_11400 [Bacteroidetes bacterium]|nr:hypothetical protein [Bacteroidota bacterium]
MAKILLQGELIKIKIKFLQIGSFVPKDWKNQVKWMFTVLTP